MRVMLGNDQLPSLLVEVEGNTLPDKFHFWVVNGCWEGYYNNGYITISDDFTSLDKCDILTTNQDRLRGDYNDVFNNFHNENYVSPSYKLEPDDLECMDNIPF